jgi:hypothetical protein
MAAKVGRQLQPADEVQPFDARHVQPQRRLRQGDDDAVGDGRRCQGRARENEQFAVAVKVGSDGLVWPGGALHFVGHGGAAQQGGGVGLGRRAIYRT